MSERGPAHNAPDVESGVALGEQATVAASTPAPHPHASSASNDDWTGREVAGRYTIIGHVGEGGMGMVYEAEHLHLKKRVAFKVIRPELARHPELLARFKREALATGQLDHPHIASAIDFGELDDGGAFMVMPLIRGHSLQQEIEKGERMPLRRAALLCSQIADALSAAHAVGIVHRDLKPDNVLIEQRSDGSEAAKVLDFGVASLAGQGAVAKALAARPLTQAGTILGTPGYMSPEQATAGEVDHRTDLYALGVILWELCRGERLFDGDDITAIFAKQFNSVPPALELGGSGAARELSELVSLLLSWDKNQRPTTAAEVRDRLRRIAEQPDLTYPRMSFAPPAMRKHAPYVVAAVSLVIAIVAVTWNRDEPAPLPAPQANATAAPKAEEKAPARKPKAPETRDEKPNKEPEKAPENPRVEAAASAIVTELREAQETLLTSARRDARRAAAKKLLQEPDLSPKFVALSAELELATRCAERKKLIGELKTLGDPRALGPLKRLADQPRRGCGLLRLNDCLACVRRDLDEAIRALQDIGS